MAWNKQVALQYLRSHSESKSLHRCAEYTRRAIEAGGLKLSKTANAKDYGRSLLAIGFREVPQGSTLIAGDVAVTQPYTGGNPSGHMTMYDGRSWISDFTQRTMYPGPGYRKYRPPYKIYRMY